MVRASSLMECMQYPLRLRLLRITLAMSLANGVDERRGRRFLARLQLALIEQTFIERVVGYHLVALHDAQRFLCLTQPRQRGFMDGFRLAFAVIVFANFQRARKIAGLRPPVARLHDEIECRTSLAFARLDE